MMRIFPRTYTLNVQSCARNVITIEDVGGRLGLYLFSSVTNRSLLLQIYNDITIILRRHNTMPTQCFSNRSMAINLLSNLY